MNASTASEIARLETMTITKVVERFESLFGEKCRSRNKRYLIRRIAWRLQANAEGDLSERAKARAAELALDSDVRVTPPRETIQPRLVTSDVQSRPALDQRLPPPGSMLHREYKGRQIRVLIVNNGLEYEGQLFKSLTAVASAITGSHVNGLSYLARLLVDPGRKIPAAFLLAAEMGIDPRIPVGSSGPVLDDKALAAYRKTYHEITHDLEEAKRNHDHARMAELETQKETFSAEIEKATGLGGRKREKSDSERVRKNVTNAVARAIEAVAQEHERLGKHLRNSITSGSLFSYDPEQDPQWLV